MQHSRLAAVPLCVQTAESISRRIRVGELHAGQRLPSERQRREAPAIGIAGLAGYAALGTGLPGPAGRWAAEAAYGPRVAQAGRLGRKARCRHNSCSGQW